MPSQEMDWSKVIAASVVPVVLISASALLCLAFYNRLASIVSRLRGFQRERIHEQRWLAHPPAGENTEHDIAVHRELLKLLDEQTVGVTRRARLIRATLMCLLCTIATLIVCSLCTGMSVVWAPAGYLALALFFLAVGILMLGVFYAIKELGGALDPVELEGRAIARLSAYFDNPNSV
ncbi:MAG TPA: DUF2721 domain-containing protein [Tepidisphaeraceae bacterium]